MFGSYEVLSVLGTGATSTVYLARHLRLKTYRAVKCISKTRSMPSSVLVEADLMEHLKHPGIPILYDLEEDEEFIYLVEEYIQGESLEDILLHTESISQEYVMQIGIQICSVLSFLHHLKPYPILYQDLKPSHIIVCGNQIKLIDFGFASFISSQGKKYHKYGTKGFAAPEQYGDGSMQIQSDVYQLGAIFRLYDKTHRGACSRAFRNIIRKSTREDPEKRYPSIQSLQQALQSALMSGRKPESSLLRSISVVGAHPGAGATHIAIALTSSLNRSGNHALYVEHGGSQVYRSVVRSCRLPEEILDTEYIHSDRCQNVEIAGYREFRCCVAQEEDIQESWKECSQAGKLMVHDYGDDIAAAVLQEAECTILVVNLSVWQREAAGKAYECLKCMPGLKVLCNLSSRREAKALAAHWNCSVYCYPYEESPFGADRKREALFTQMLKEKGEGNRPWKV
ncbi:MAG: serine/threonine protein kinase [Lachnospiraceae bacterium]|nr:serine/threonine protein kinase [Lachnospiraceae bacterium]